MNIFVIFFAIFIIIIFFALAVKRGSQTRREIIEIEKAENKAAGGREEDSDENSEKQSGIIGSVNSIKNTVGRTLKQFGVIIMLAGTILSLCLARTETEGAYSAEYGFSLLTFFAYWLIYCTAGFFFIGLGEIIRLLDDISRGLKRS